MILAGLRFARVEAKKGVSTHRGIAFGTGLGIGTGLMFLLDPDQGKRRRALLRDQMLLGCTENRMTGSNSNLRQVIEETNDGSAITEEWRALRGAKDRPGA